MSSGSAFEIEVRMRKGDGSYRWFLARYNSVREDQGQVLRWYAAFTDIEDRKRAEEKLQQENATLREEIDKASMFEEIVGISPALQAVLSRIPKVAPSDSTVLITGETGTGKELVARAIHRRSHRASCAFVSVNCTAIPRDLIASESFGHEKGSFTGAMQRRIGRFELAEGGTIFLDEVGELSADTQVALLRVLQERDAQGQLFRPHFQGKKSRGLFRQTHCRNDSGRTAGPFFIHLAMPPDELLAKIFFIAKLRTLKKEDFTKPTKFSTLPFCRA